MNKIIIEIEDYKGNIKLDWLTLLMFAVYDKKENLKNANIETEDYEKLLNAVINGKVEKY